MSLDKTEASKKQVVGVLLDIGNSETRVKIKFKPIKGLENSGYTPVEETFAMSNHYRDLSETYAIGPDYQNKDTTIMDIDGLRIAHGELVEREFTSSLLRPTGKGNKSGEEITRYTLHRVLIEVYHKLQGYWDTNNVDVAFNVFVLIPPAEHLYSKEDMINLVADINEVIELVPVGDEVNYTPVKYPIICNDIQVFPEGVTAFIGMRTNIVGNKLTPNPDVEKYMKGYALVIDVGAGTTDLAIMQDGKLKADSRKTITDAGSHIISALNDKLNRNPKLRGRLVQGIKDINSVMSEAMVREGGGLIEADCAQELNEAKEDVANALAYQIQDYFNNLNVAALIKGILVCGGANEAAIRNGTTVSPALETFLIPKIQKYADLAELIPIRNRDTRYLNLDGLESLYITYQIKQQKAKEAKEG